MVVAAQRNLEETRESRFFSYLSIDAKKNNTIYFCEFECFLIFRHFCILVILAYEQGTSVCKEAQNDSTAAVDSVQPPFFYARLDKLPLLYLECGTGVTGSIGHFGSVPPMQL